MIECRGSAAKRSHWDQCCSGTEDISGIYRIPERKEEKKTEEKKRKEEKRNADWTNQKP